MKRGQLVYAPAKDIRLLLSYVSKCGEKFIGKDKHNNYYKGLCSQITPVQ